MYNLEKKHLKKNFFKKYLRKMRKNIKQVYTKKNYNII